MGLSPTIHYGISSKDQLDSLPLSVSCSSNAIYTPYNRSDTPSGNPYGYHLCTGYCVFEHLHNCYLTSLSLGTRYSYQISVRDLLGRVYVSEMFTFKTRRDSSDDDYAPTLAVYGDMGVVNGLSVPLLIKETQNQLIDAVLHVCTIFYICIIYMT